MTGKLMMIQSSYAKDRLATFCENFFIYLLCFYLVFQPVIAQAGTLTIPGFNGSVTPPANTALPVLKNPGVLPTGVSSFDTSTPNKLVINQSQSQTIIDWSSFNIGADATVYFNQKGNTSWVALNRIYSLNPSLIFGTLKADGKIYLINQNGILFGPGSQVNINTLVASALNIRNNDFINGSLNFYVDKGGAGSAYPDLTFDAAAIVSNQGTINATAYGSVFLIAPLVENFGVINSPFGQIGLIAGTAVKLTADPTLDTTRTALVALVSDGFGQAVNGEGGQLIADSGMIGMYGKAVNQDGLIRAVTAVTKKGEVELRATDTISTGPNSIIEIPVSTASDTANDSFSFAQNQQGTVTLDGLQKIDNSTSSPRLVSSTPPQYIEHQGIIDAPSGIVTMNATQRVLLDTGSEVNVSGAWTSEPASAELISVQLNSVELRDDPAQKGGVLQGQTITTTVTSGSSIGDISTAILNREKTALERAINGGTISVNCGGGNSDIIIKDGATLDFSGGGINYSGGIVNTTKLLSGGKIYDISNAPIYLKYDKIFGGLGTYVAAHSKGGDAGSLLLAAGTVVLDGQLKGSATRGIFQNAWTPVDLTSGSSYLLSVAQGLEIPRSGTLEISVSGAGTDYMVNDIQIVSPASSLLQVLPAGFGLTSQLPDQTTILSSEILSDASLGTLSLITNMAISTEKDSVITLAPRGTFTASASQIDHNGNIIVPDGTISLTISDTNTNTSGYVPLEGRIFLASGSELSTAGEKVDNSLAGNTSGALNVTGNIDGGTITILDKEESGQGVFLQSGAIVDVSGGYRISAKGTVTAGQAGSLTISGSAIELDGDIRGYALPDANGKISGGQITLSADNISVTSTSTAWPASFNIESAVPDAMKDRLILAGNRFEDTGFTQINLNSVNDITMDNNTVLSSSLVRLNIPAATSGQGAAMPVQNFSTIGDVLSGHNDLIRLNSAMAYQAGTSAITATAGVTPLYVNTAVNGADINNTAEIKILPGAVISTAPEGKIVLTANGAIDMRGTLESDAGNVSLISKNNSIDIGDSGEILASSYNRLSATAVQGLGPNYTPRNGGQINLTANLGDIDMEQGSLVDVSGSQPVEDALSTGLSIVSTQTAGNPGSLSLSFGNNLTWAGIVNAQAKMAGIQGGTLTISKTNSGNVLSIGGDDLGRYVTAGFDNITLKSANALLFNGTMDATIGRQLTLDAPIISGSGTDSVTLRSAWIQVLNTSNAASSTPAAGLADLDLSGQWIYVTGSILLSGFQSVRLEATRDICLQDSLYGTNYEGNLAMAGDMWLKADRIYPTTYSSFTLKADGTITILPSDQPVGGPIYSAGGSLTVTAGKDLDNSGTLAAPMGTIALSAGGRIYLADGSTVTTSGNALVNYGVLDDNNQWWLQDRVTKNNTSTIDADNLPGQKGAGQYNISLNANEVIVRDGALIDASGGGSVFAYQWRAGAEGSSDPLAKAGRYIVLSGNSIVAPGPTVYLEGGGGLSAGMYTLLPASQYGQYAFLPNAYIIDVQSLTIAPGQKTVTKEGYPVVAGYTAVAGTSIQSTQATAYSVRTAADVLSEGHYDTLTLTAGNAGSVKISGNTTILDGTVSAAALDGYQGGLINLGGKNVYVLASTIPLPAGFDYNSPVPAGLVNQLNVTADALSGKGFKEIDLGDQNNTDTVTIEGGSVLQAGIISLAAKNTITVESGAQLQGVTTTGSGEVNLTSPNGTAIIQTGALLHASHSFNWDVGNMDIEGNLQLDDGILTLHGAEIYFVPDAYTPSGPGIYLTQKLWGTFAGFEDITLQSNTDVLFRDSFNLTALGSITIDAARISGDTGVNVSIAAPTLSFKNSSGNSSTALPASTNTAGAFTAAADKITVGGGDVLFDNFTTVQLNSQHDLILQGAGSLTTGNAALGISAARITTSAGLNSGGTYQAADFHVYTGANYYNDSANPNPQGIITITQSGGTPGTTSTPGGTLEFWGKSIENGTVSEKGTIIQVDGGNINLVATGAGSTDGVFLRDGAQILAKGTGEAPGGKVTLRTDNGSIALDAGSIINVDAGTQGEAGTITLSAPTGGVTIGGTLSGKANGGAGGSFVLDTHELSDADLSNLIVTLASGGFTQSVDLRSRIGSIDIAGGQTLTARNVTLTADDQSTGNGQINISGTINASGDTGGGQVELYAANDVTLQNGGKIDVRGTAADANGGEVLLSSEGGYVNLNPGSVIDASASGTGLGGLVHLRALRNGNDVQMNLDGTVNGVSNFIVEAVKVYENVSTINNTTVATWNSDNKNYMANAAAIQSRLLNNLTMSGWNTGQFNLLPGIEARSNSDMTLTTDIDLTSYRYGGEPGVLTLLAAGNLNINHYLVDYPTPYRNNQQTAGLPWNSWAFNLVAGADPGSANYMATVRGKGNLIIADNQIVYTEQAPIRFASGNDTVIGVAADPSQAGIYPQFMFDWFAMYNLASYAGSIQGQVGRDLVLAGGAIQTATGDINITAGRDIVLANGVEYNNTTLMGSIRTTGQSTLADLNNSNLPWSTCNFTNYSGGGNITLDVGRDVGIYTGDVLSIALNSNAWDMAYDASWSGGNSAAPIWGPSYSEVIFGKPTTEGIVTMAGGNLSIHAGGDFLAQAGAFGQGNFSVYAGGDVRGRFLIKQGSAEIYAGGNVGANTQSPFDKVVVEAFDTQLNISAQGNIELGAVVNPTIAHDGFINFSDTSLGPWNLQYTENTSVDLNALGGDITMYGYTPYYKTDQNLMLLLPATLEMQAGGNIYIKNTFYMMPSPTGNLSLIAGGNIDGSYKSSEGTKRGSILLSDIAPSDVYGVQTAFPSAIIDKLMSPTSHNASGDPLHMNDNVAVEVEAGQDIEDLRLYLPKKAVITAGRNILDIFYFGQNINTGDVSVMSAGSQISFHKDQFLKESDLKGTGVVQAGPGAFVMQAGGNIDLGNTLGIKSIGDAYNPLLSTDGSTLLVISGYKQEITPNAAATFFHSLEDATKAWAEAGSLDEKATIAQQAQTDVIEPTLGVAEASGGIDMTSTQISTSSANGNIFIITNGNLNVGKSVFFTNQADVQSTGILTAGGGSIGIFANGDVNVNESRVMTFFGGDITVWSNPDDGKINAGRGSKTTVNASAPKLVPTGQFNDAGQPIMVLQFSPPAVGSGIRAVTYDPDGAGGPLQAPRAGDIYLYANTIDAGEAGISGGRVILAANQVINAGNISFTSGSIGVPSTASATTGIGNLSGSGSVAQNSQMLSNASGIGAAGAASASQMIDDIMTKWLDVKVIDFINDNDSNDEYKKCILKGGTEKDCANI
jgi:filamentous hemagglutinin family protein